MHLQRSNYSTTFFVKLGNKTESLEVKATWCVLNFLQPVITTWRTAKLLQTNARS
jgi:hypothetical protein